MQSGPSGLCPMAISGMRMPPPSASCRFKTRTSSSSTPSQHIHSISASLCTKPQQSLETKKQKKYSYHQVVSQTPPLITVCYSVALTSSGSQSRYLTVDQLSKNFYQNITRDESHHLVTQAKSMSSHSKLPPGDQLGLTRPENEETIDPGPRLAPES